MSIIALPQKIKFEKGKEDFEGNIVVEPCFPGYGITLGNSLRRVLLSSLPGAAPIGIKIQGVDHEFSTLAHLKEDILEFILNVKQLRLKVHTDEIVKLELDVHGKKEIKASDIKENSLVEIINKDFVLGHITDMAGKLNAEIYVSRGMGYETIESREEKSNEIGYIDIDSIFSPVLVAGVTLENVRVGKMTNWDKLILNIKTDGSITPEEAFNQSVQILINQFSVLVPGGAKKEEEKVEVEEEKEEVEEKRETKKKAKK